MREEMAVRDAAYSSEDMPGAVPRTAVQMGTTGHDWVGYKVECVAGAYAMLILCLIRRLVDA